MTRTSGAIGGVSDAALTASGLAFGTPPTSASRAASSRSISGVMRRCPAQDCTGFHNGRRGSSSCNFLTTHDCGKWIDLRRR